MAIVGARACTEYGKEAAGFYAGELANAGVNVISGMAAGVDGFAHRGAIERGKPTYAVLGCGLPALLFVRLGCSGSFCY